MEYYINENDIGELDICAKNKGKITKIILYKRRETQNHLYHKIPFI
jgi:hypothetical protein